MAKEKINFIKEKIVKKNELKEVVEVPKVITNAFIPTLFEEPKFAFACPKCGGEMKVLKAVNNEKVWECAQCKYKHCQMR